MKYLSTLKGSSLYNLLKVKCSFLNPFKRQTMKKEKRVISMDLLCDNKFLKKGFFVRRFLYHFHQKRYQ